MQKKPSEEQRRELGTFLFRRRAHLKPTDFGLQMEGRRTPGLRREEVAVLAGVSVSWYTWLEQGRDIQASADALRRIAKVLQFDRVEFAHLFALSGRQPPQFNTPEGLSNGLELLVRTMNPIPVYIRNSRLDILFWNDAIAKLFIDYGSLPASERNTLWLLFLFEPYRTLIIDWKHMARGMIATFRAARALAVDKAPFDSLIAELSDRSPEFNEWWQDRDVQGFDEGCKRLQHPSMGKIEFTYVSLTPQGRPDLSLVSYIPRSSDGDDQS